MTVSRKAPFCLMLAPNGARLSKAVHARVPLAPAEIAATARACATLGVGALHLHVRDADGGHSLDAARYRAAMEAVGRAVPGLAIQVTTEAAGRYDVAAQLALLGGLKPRRASVAVREMGRDPELARRFYRQAAAQGTRLQHILYDRDDLALLLDWRKRGWLAEAACEVLFVLGRYDPPREARPEEVAPLADLARRHGLDWSLCAFGPHEHDCLLAALSEGSGQVRIGFENSYLQPDGTPYADNAASVAAFVARAEAAGFTPESLERA